MNLKNDQQLPTYTGKMTNQCQKEDKGVVPLVLFMPPPSPLLIA